MTMLTLGEAARLTGLGKTTIQRSIKAGRLSALRTELGSYQIDPAELHRVYPIKAATVAETDDVERDATTDVLVSELRAVISDLRSDRDHWRSAFEREQAALAATQRLLPPPLEQHATPDASVPEQHATPVEQPAPPKRRWWKWVAI